MRSPSIPGAGMHERPQAKAFVNNQLIGRSALLQGVLEDPCSLAILSSQPDALQASAVKSLAIVAGRQLRRAVAGKTSRVCRSWVANREKTLPARLESAILHRSRECGPMTPFRGRELGRPLIATTSALRPMSDTEAIKAGTAFFAYRFYCSDGLLLGASPELRRSV